MQLGLKLLTSQKSSHVEVRKVPAPVEVRKLAGSIKDMEDWRRCVKMDFLNDY